ncbi:MAG TPA: prepilin-type N-terminal cleavage/methylation domain-containing protein [Gammaproteobacteria bacterium]
MKPVIKPARQLSLTRTRGFTLVEIIITIVLVSTMMAGLTALFIHNAEHSYRPYLRQRALAVANAFMEEISRKRWDENSPIGGGCVNTGASCAAGPAEAGIGTEEGARADYDDIDDYGAIANQTPPQDSSGAAMPGYGGFSVTVTVTQPAWNGVPAADVKLITVDVISPSNETITLRAYRMNI